MTDDCVQVWYNSGKRAKINHICLRPLENPLLKNTPLVIKKGQAEVYFLQDDQGKIWVLKKFYNGRYLGYGYLKQIGSLLPSHPGFIAGTMREVLSKNSLQRGPKLYDDAQFAQWLVGTVLMPKIDGVDWSAHADDLRENLQTLDRDCRLILCQELSALIDLLEQHKIAHRDLSSGNVFMDIASQQVSLIDFDSVYHPSLDMPPATTCGTLGYTAPYLWQNGKLDAHVSWSPNADRYALALLNTEILVLSKDAPLSAEGGMFEQEELCHRSGPSIDLARELLNRDYPMALHLFEKVINSSRFTECTSPREWLKFSRVCQVKIPRIIELEEVQVDYMRMVLQKQRSAAPLWPAPPLSEMPDFDIEIETVPVSVVRLPKDPWKS